jgi:hypothetical protein
MEFLILAGVLVTVIALIYLATAASAYIRDLRRLPPNTPDLRGLSDTRPNWSLWKRRMRSDPADMWASLIRGLSGVSKLAIAALLLALILGIIAALIYGVTAVGSALGSAPGWAIIIIVLLVIIAFK